MAVKKGERGRHEGEKTSPATLLIEIRVTRRFEKITQFYKK